MITASRSKWDWQYMTFLTPPTFVKYTCIKPLPKLLVHLVNLSCFAFSGFISDVFREMFLVVKHFIHAANIFNTR
jgi:hypothetical protein